jgi:hypothetical protein
MARRTAFPSSRTKTAPSRIAVVGTRTTGLAGALPAAAGLGSIALKLYQITGEHGVRDRATRIFAFQKGRFQFVNDDRYVWNYWGPYGARDVDLAAGVVFDETDIRRILETNLQANVERQLRRSGVSEFKSGFAGRESEEYGGHAWTALADFGETVRRLAKGSDPVTFERKRLCAALPGKFRASEGTLPASNSLVRGTLDGIQIRTCRARIRRIRRARFGRSSRTSTRRCEGWRRGAIR